MCAAFITLFTPFEYLSDMTSISSLFGFFVVALALLWRRYYGVAGRAKGANPYLPALLLAWLAASGLGQSPFPVIAPQENMAHVPISIGRRFMCCTSCLWG